MTSYCEHRSSPVSTPTMKSTYATHTPTLVKVMPKTDFGDNVRREFRKTAAHIGNQPWNLLKGQDYLEKLCDANEQGVTPAGPELSAIWDYKIKDIVLQDTLLIPAPGGVNPDSSVPACQRRRSRRNERSCVNALPLLMTRLLRAACVDALQQMGVAMARQRVLRVLLTLLFRKRLLQQRLLTQLEQHPRPPPIVWLCQMPLCSRWLRRKVQEVG